MYEKIEVSTWGGIIHTFSGNPELRRLHDRVVVSYDDNHHYIMSHRHVSLDSMGHRSSVEFRHADVENIVCVPFPETQELTYDPEPVGTVEAVNLLKGKARVFLVYEGESPNIPCGTKVRIVEA